MMNHAENPRLLTAKHTAASAIAALMMLTASGAAQAKDDDVQQCSSANLQGLYAFHASGFNIVSGAAPQPKAIVELIQFNGDGTITGGGPTVSINGAIIPIPPGTGTYGLAADCINGSLKFGDGKTFDFVVGFRQAQLYMIQTNPFTVFEGTAERLSR